jgi:hypothetical protein
MSPADAAHQMVSLIARRKGVVDPRYVRETVSWILSRDGWLSPVWSTLRNYSGDKNLIRFRNDLSITLPKAQWPFETPHVFRYELTAHVSELSDGVLLEIIAYSELARTASKGRGIIGLTQG